MSDMDATNPTIIRHLLLLLSLIEVLNAYQELLPRMEEEDGYDGGGEYLAYLGNRVFQNPNPEFGEKLKKWNDTWDVNPEELGDYAEGDIVFPKHMEKNGVVIEAARWPDAIIPYEIKGDFSSMEMRTIKGVMKLYEAKTCIKFRPRQPSHADWIEVLSQNTGCWSSVGRRGGAQTVNLQRPACLIRVGTVIHEFLHAVGFIHQHSTWNRDVYVKVKWKNINKGREMNFVKRNKYTVTNFGVPYDYDSVMHYSRRAFSKNKEATLVPKARNAFIGQRRSFSPSDIKKILRMYNCPIEVSLESNTNGQEKQICTSIFIILSHLLIVQ